MLRVRHQCLQPVHGEFFWVNQQVSKEHPTRDKLGGRGLSQSKNVSVLTRVATLLTYEYKINNKIKVVFNILICYLYINF